MRSNGIESYEGPLQSRGKKDQPWHQERPRDFEASDEGLAEAAAASEALPSVLYQEAIKRRRGRDASVGSGKEADNIAA